MCFHNGGGGRNNDHPMDPSCRSVGAVPTIRCPSKGQLRPLGQCHGTNVALHLSVGFQTDFQSLKQGSFLEMKVLSPHTAHRSFPRGDLGRMSSLYTSLKCTPKCCKPLRFGLVCRLFYRCSFRASGFLLETRDPNSLDEARSEPLVAAVKQLPCHDAIASDLKIASS